VQPTPAVADQLISGGGGLVAYMSLSVL